MKTAKNAGAALELVAASLRRPDVLVNAAGITLDTPIIDTDVRAFDRLMAVNLRGTFLVNREFARRHIAAATRAPATIINVSSMPALVVNVPQTQAAYNTSKAAVGMFTKSSAIEFLPHGIRVKAIAPGYFASDMTRDFVADHPEMGRAWTSRVPSGRMGLPEELGDLVVYLASERSAYMVGQSLVIDGGYTLV